MADLAQTAVSITKATRLALTGGNRRILEVSLTLTGQGTATNKINASVLGLTKIIESSPLTASDNSLVIVAAPSADGTYLLLKAAGTNAPADYTATLLGVIQGY